jgi:hypothetical protein
MTLTFEDRGCDRRGRIGRERLHRFARQVVREPGLPLRPLEGQPQGFRREDLTGFDGVPLIKRRHESDGESSVCAMTAARAGWDWKAASAW